MFSLWQWGNKCTQRLPNPPPAPAPPPVGYMLFPLSIAKSHGKKGVYPASSKHMCALVLTCKHTCGLNQLGHVLNVFFLLAREVHAWRLSLPFLHSRLSHKLILHHRRFFLVLPPVSHLSERNHKVLISQSAINHYRQMQTAQCASSWETTEPIPAGDARMSWQAVKPELCPPPFNNAALCNISSRWSFISTCSDSDVIFSARRRQKKERLPAAGGVTTR